VALFRTLPDAKGSFATKWVNPDLLGYEPQGRTRIRMSLMPPALAKLLDVRTSPVAERIAAIPELHRAGYEVHLNFSPVVLREGWEAEWSALFAELDDVLPAAVKDQLAAEIIMLTHNEDLHEINLAWHPKAEELLWRPDIQEQKVSESGAGEPALPHRLEGSLAAALQGPLACPHALLPGALCLLRRQHPTRARCPPAPPAAWRPKRLLVTPAALGWPHGAAMVERAAALGAEVVRLKADRLSGLPDSYRDAKTTMAVVAASPSRRKPQPIPPSADWRVDLAEGCPAHCAYCYLAGSLAGPPIIRAYANLPEILAALPPLLGQGEVTSRDAARAAEGTTFEAPATPTRWESSTSLAALAETIRSSGAAWTRRLSCASHQVRRSRAAAGLPNGRRTAASRFSVKARGDGALRGAPRG
jgi:DNA repair photolyase